MPLVLDNILGSSGLLAVSSAGLLRTAGGSVVVEAPGDSTRDSLLMGQCNSVVSCVSVSPVDGGVFATGELGANPDICVWELEGSSVSLLGRIEDHDTDVIGLAFSVDSRYIFSISSSQYIVHENIPPYTALCQVAVPHIATACLVQGGYMRDIKRRDVTALYQLASCGNKNVHFWQYDSVARHLEPLPISSGLKQVRDYTCLAFSEDLEILFVGSTSGDVLSVLAKNRVVQTLSAPLVAGGVTALALPLAVRPPAGLSVNLFIGAGDGSVVLAKTTHTEITPVHKILLSSASPGRVRSFAFLPSGEIFVGSAGGSVVSLHFSDTDKKSNSSSWKTTHRGSAARVAQLRFPRGESAVLFSAGDEIGEWRQLQAGDAATVQTLSSGKALGAECVDAVADFFVVGGTAGKLHGFARGEDFRKLWSIDGATRGRCMQTRISGNNRFVLAAGSEGELRLFDLKTKEMMTHFKEHSGCVSGLELFGDGQLAITAAKDRAIVVYDLKAERRISVHRERHQGVNAIAISEATQTVVTAADRGLSFWDLRMQEPTRTVELKHEVKTLALADHAHGNFGVTGDVAGAVTLWDFRAGHPAISDYHSPGRHVGEVASVALAPDGRSVVSAGGLDHSLFLWNIFE